MSIILLIVADGCADGTLKDFLFEYSLSGFGFSKVPHKVERVGGYGSFYRPKIGGDELP